MATPVPDESTCVSMVVDQVGQVWNAAAGVASYVTGNAAIAKAVEKLLQLVDFFIHVIFTDQDCAGLVEILRGVENCRRIHLGCHGLCD